MTFKEWRAASGSGARGAAADVVRSSGDESRSNFEQKPADVVRSSGDESRSNFEQRRPTSDQRLPRRRWQAYLQQQKKEQKSSKASAASYSDLSDKAGQSQSFQELYKKLKAAGG